MHKAKLAANLKLLHSLISQHQDRHGSLKFGTFGILFDSFTIGLLHDEGEIYHHTKVKMIASAELEEFYSLQKIIKRALPTLRALRKNGRKDPAARKRRPAKPQPSVG